MKTHTWARCRTCGEQTAIPASVPVSISGKCGKCGGNLEIHMGATPPAWAPRGWFARLIERVWK